MVCQTIDYKNKISYKRYSDMYLLDNQMQCLTAMEDQEYTKWLDPEGVPCYVKDSVSRKITLVGMVNDPQSRMDSNKNWWSH